MNGLKKLKSYIPFRPTLDHARRRRLILPQNDLPVPINHRVRLHKYLAGHLPADDLSADRSGEELVHMRHLLVQRRAGLHICRALVDVQLQEVLLDGLAADSRDLVAVDGDGETVRRGGAVRDGEGDEVLAGIKEALQDGEARLHVRLSPLPAGRVPELKGGQAGPGHGEVRDEEDVEGFLTSVFEQREDGRFAAERHGDRLGAAFFVAGGDGAEDGTPRLGWQVP